MEIRCLRKLLGITYRDHISNEEVRNRTRQAIGPHEDILTTVKRRRLKWYGHITRSSGLAKTILQGTVQGGRRRGRQKKRWEDNIPEWTGMTLGAAMRKTERRDEWRELVARLGKFSARLLNSSIPFNSIKQKENINHGWPRSFESKLVL